MKKITNLFNDKVITAIIALMIMMLSGLATAQTQLGDVDITNLITQENDAENDYLILVAGTVTDTTYGKHCDCTDYNVQQVYITTDNDFPTVIEITRDLVITANQNVNIGNNVVLIDNSSLIYANGDPFVASDQTTVTFTENCNSQPLLIGNAQVFNTREEYEQTLHINTFIIQNPNLPFDLYDINGKLIYKNRETLRGLESGFWLAIFTDYDNDRQIAMSFIKSK